MRYMIEPGLYVGRDAYVEYLYDCARRWACLGAQEQAGLVSAKATLIAAGKDDVSQNAGLKTRSIG